MGTITFKMYPHLGLAHFQGFGDISHDMIIQQLRQLHNHPDWRFKYNTFVDFETAVVSIETASSAGYQNVFGAQPEATSIRKWAILTCQEMGNKAVEMNRLLNSRGIIVDVFRSRDDALKFLNISPHHLAEPTGTE